MGVSRMTDYISREAALLSMTPIVKRASERNRNILSAVKQCVDAINWCPAANVAPVRHGRWVELEDGDCKCSLCGCYHHAWEAHGYYCQHCGARMDGAEPPKEET